MNLFDIIGPVMIGPSSSHTAGAARIGKVALKILGEQGYQVDKVSVVDQFGHSGHVETVCLLSRKDK